MFSLKWPCRPLSFRSFFLPLGAEKLLLIRLIFYTSKSILLLRSNPIPLTPTYHHPPRFTNYTILPGAISICWNTDFSEAPKPTQSHHPHHFTTIRICGESPSPHPPSLYPPHLTTIANHQQHKWWVTCALRSYVEFVGKLAENWRVARSVFLYHRHSCRTRRKEGRREEEEGKRSKIFADWYMF